jgi:hypothetical protein
MLSGHPASTLYPHPQHCGSLSAAGVMQSSSSSPLSVIASNGGNVGSTLFSVPHHHHHHLLPHQHQGCWAFPTQTSNTSNMVGSSLASMTTSSGKRKRRHRTIFTEEQLEKLEATFLQTHYPDVLLREQLALTVDLKEERVEVSYSYRLENFTELLLGLFAQRLNISFYPKQKHLSKKNQREKGEMAGDYASRRLKERLR